jgi:FMN phosphatase YigB (HAD superfamily)
VTERWATFDCYGTLIDWMGAELGLTAVWINRLGERSDLPRASELPDLQRLQGTLDHLVPA